MKKILTSLAVALTLSSTAFGVDYNAKATFMQPASLGKANLVVGNSTSAQAKAPAKAPTAEEASGVYYYSYYATIAGPNGGDQEASWKVSINGTSAEILGIFGDFPVKATFDPSTGNLIIKPQDLMVNTNYNEMMKLYILQSYDENMEVLETPKYLDEMVFHYMPEGVETNGGDFICKNGWVAPQNLTIFVSCDSFKDVDGNGNPQIGAQGFLFNVANYVQTLPEVYDTAYFEYDAAEWKDAGTASFTDGWFYLREYTYDVPLKAKADGSKEYLLVNPYDNAAISGLTDEQGGNTAADKTGYIYINAENPDCVLVRPFVTSGWENTKLLGGVASTTVLNKEGQKVYMEYYSPEEVVEEFTGIGEKTSTLDENGKITIVNATFAIITNLPTPTSWQEKDTGVPIDMTTYIQLPTAGVDGIIADSENAPVRYYNLQGMEVANPEAGQLVIKKQGSKTTKLIAR